MLNLTRLHLGIAHESQFQGLGLRVEKTAVLHGPSRAQNALSRAPQDVVFGVVPKTAQRYARSDRFGFCRDQGIDAAPLEGTIDLRVRISGIGGNPPYIDPTRLL